MREVSSSIAKSVRLTHSDARSSWRLRSSSRCCHMRSRAWLILMLWLAKASRRLWKHSCRRASVVESGSIVWTLPRWSKTRCQRSHSMQPYRKSVVVIINSKSSAYRLMKSQKVLACRVRRMSLRLHQLKRLLRKMIFTNHRPQDLSLSRKPAIEGWHLMIRFSQMTKQSCQWISELSLYPPNRRKSRTRGWVGANPSRGTCEQRN